MRENLKPQDSLSTFFTQASATSQADPSVGSASTSFRTAATSQSVGSSLLRNLLPSARSMNSNNNNNNTNNDAPPGGGGRRRAAGRMHARRAAVDVEALEREVSDLRADLDMMRANRQQEQQVYTMELRKIECEKSAIEKRMQILLRDMNDKNAMGEYAALIRKAAPGSIDSSYVLKLQAQLAKAMHQMGVVQNQLTLTEQACDGVVKEMKEQMRKSCDRAAKAEIDYLNQIMRLQDDNITMKRRLDALELEQQMRIVEEDALVVAEDEEDEDHRPPPVDGIRIKASSKSKLEQEQNAHRKPSSRGRGGGSGRNMSASTEERSSVTDDNEEEPPPPIGGIRIKANSKTKLEDRKNAQQHRKLSPKEGGSGRNIASAGNEEPSSARTPVQRKSPTRSRAADRSRTGDEPSSTSAARAQRKVSRAKAATQGSVGDTTSSSRSSQRRPPSKTRAENQHTQQQTGEGPAIGRVLVVKSSSKNKGDFPRSSCDVDDDDDANPLPERGVAKRDSDRSARARAGNQQQQTNEALAFGKGLMVKSTSSKSNGDDDAGQLPEMLRTKRDDERSRRKRGQNPDSTQEKGWVEFGESGHFGEDWDQSD